VGLGEYLAKYRVIVIFSRPVFYTLGSVISTNDLESEAVATLKVKGSFAYKEFPRVVILNAKGHEPTQKGAERFYRIYFLYHGRPEKSIEMG